MRTAHIHSLPELWQPTALVFAALGDPTRQKILLLFEPCEELSIKQICEVFELGRTTIVHHLTALEKASLLTVRREGKLALYAVQHDILLDALDNVRGLIEEDFPVYKKTD